MQKTLKQSQDGLYHFQLHTGRKVAFRAPTMKVLRHAMQIAPECGKLGADNLALKEELFMSLFAKDGERAMDRDSLLVAGGLDLFSFHEAQELLEAVGEIMNPPKPSPEAEGKPTKT